MVKFELEPYHRNTPEKELIADLKRVASELKKDAISGSEYNKHGKFADQTLARRFGSWLNALAKAGLKRKTMGWGTSDEEYFKNLEEVWIKLGRQPRFREIEKPLSKYSISAYEYKFGSLGKALKKFIEYTNKEDVPADDAIPPVIDKTGSPKEEIASIPTKIPVIKNSSRPIDGHKTKRDISERLKVQVLIRDGNKCRLCGITVTGENIHFDHIKAWSKGGETVLENLQVLCAEHNLAKGNL